MILKVNRKAAVKKLKVLMLSGKSDVEPFRARVEQTFSQDCVPAKTECAQKEYGGVKCDVLSPEIYASNKVMLYVHGGSFVAGSRDSWRPFCAQLASASSCRVVVPEFRLPPSHPYPAAIDDVHAVFRLLHAELDMALRLEKEENERPVEMVVAADGSGASIAMALLFKLSAEERKSLHTIALISPWLDLSAQSELLANRRLKDEVMSAENLRSAADLYTYASNLESPQVSPLRAAPEDFAHFPPVFIQCGEKEMLLRQSQNLAKVLESQGVSCVLDVWPGMMPLFQFADEYLAQSHLAVERMGKFISRRKDDESELMERREILRRNNVRVE